MKLKQKSRIQGGGEMFKRETIILGMNPDDLLPIVNWGKVLAKRGQKEEMEVWRKLADFGILVPWENGWLIVNSLGQRVILPLDLGFKRRADAEEVGRLHCGENDLGWVISKKIS